MLFSHALRVQLIAKNIIKPEEWDDIVSKIKYDYLEDNHYSELKDAEILTQRVQVLQLLDPFVGKYYSQAWIRKNVLRLDDEDIEQIEKEIEEEKEDRIEDAEQTGTLAGVTQAAQQNYLQQNAPQAQEAPTAGQAPQDGAAPEGVSESQDNAAPNTKDKQAPTGWPN
jgi:hypothetical protein